MVLISYLIGLLAIILSLFLFRQILRIKVTSEKVASFSESINHGARFFLTRQFQLIAVFAVVIAAIIAFFESHQSAVWIFMSGVLISMIVGLFSVIVSTKANARVAEAAQKNLRESFKIALSGSQAISLFTIGLSLIGLILFNNLFAEPILLIYYVFGISLVAFFLRIGGGIYTKSADIGADLIGKLESNIMEDDQRNPLTIVDQIGDNVGDLAGATNDLQETYVSSIIIAMILGWLSLGSSGLNFPLSLGALSLLASLIGSFAVRLSGSDKNDLLKESKKVKRAFMQGKIWSMGLFLIGSLILSFRYFDNGRYFLIILMGLIVSRLIGSLSTYYTSINGRSVARIKEASQQGVVSVILEGLHIGLSSIFIPSLIIVGAIIFSHWLGGFYGVALVAVGALGTLVIELAAHCFGPIVDNAGGIVRSIGLEESANRNTEIFDSIGNNLAAIGKSFAITTAAFTAIAWLAVYLQLTFNDKIYFLNSSVLIGLILGGALVFLFSALILKSVQKGVNSVTQSSREQLQKTLDSQNKLGNHGYLVELATKHSLREMIKPGILVLISPLIIGWLAGPEVMGGLLAGSLIVAFPLALFMTHSGTAWDNGKKLVENDQKTDLSAKQAALTGDLIGDPLKDAIAPALNILIKLIGVITLIFVSLFV